MSDYRTIGHLVLQKFQACVSIAKTTCAHYLRPVYSFLARLYESTGRAIAITLASALASALLKMLKFLVKVFIRLYLLNMLMDKLILCMLVDIGLKFYSVPS